MRLSYPHPTDVLFQLNRVDLVLLNNVDRDSKENRAYMGIVYRDIDIAMLPPIYSPLSTTPVENPAKCRCF